MTPKCKVACIVLAKSKDACGKDTNKQNFCSHKIRFANKVTQGEVLLQKSLNIVECKSLKFFNQR